MPNDNAAVKQLAEAEYILGTREGEKFPAMPLGQVHVIAGGSGAGKTTYIFQMVKAIKDGVSFFGYQTGKHKMVYAAYDRDASETEITMARAGITVEDLPFVPLKIVKPKETETDKRFEEDMRILRNAHPDAKVFIIDGFYNLVPHGKGNDYLNVAEFLQRVRVYCTDNDLTIIGIAHAPKQREGQRILDPRQMIQGSVAGAGFTSCGVVIVREKPDSNNQNRILYILPRNAPEHRFEVGMDKDGLISVASYIPVQRSEAGRPRSDRYKAFLGILASMGLVEFRVADFVQVCADHSISRGSMNQWLAELVATGTLSRVSSGTYRIEQEVPDAQ